MIIQRMQKKKNHSQEGVFCENIIVCGTQHPEKWPLTSADG